VAYLMLDGQIVSTPGPVGGTWVAGNSIMEPTKNPGNSGLYVAPLGVSAAMVPLQDVVATGNYSMVGMPRRKRSRG
jgi:hypothetical protein